MLRKTTVLSLVALFGLAGTSFGQQDKELYTAARDAMKKYDRAVVTLKTTVEISVQGELASMMPNGGKQEQKGECLATIIDPSGMAVCSLGQLDPSSMVSTIRVQGKTMTVKGTVSDLKYRLADGTEVPARVLLTDEGTDIAFVVPETTLDKANLDKIAIVPLDGAAENADILDEVVLIGRAGKTLNYEPNLMVSQVTSKLVKPRTEYVVPANQMGVPGFSRTGKLMGFTLMHRSGPSEVNADSGRIQREAAPVLLPASEVVSLLPQAKEELAKPVKKVEKKEEPATQPATPAKEEDTK